MGGQVQLGACKSRLVLGAHIRRRGGGRLLGGMQVAPDEAEHRGQGRGPCRPLAGEPRDYPVTQGLGPCSQYFEPHGAGRLEGPGVAFLGRTPALPVCITELLGPWG